VFACDRRYASEIPAHDVMTSAMSRIMSRLCDNTINLTIDMDKKIKEHKLFVDLVHCNFTYV